MRPFFSLFGVSSIGAAIALTIEHTLYPRTTTAVASLGEAIAMEKSLQGEKLVEVVANTDILHDTTKTPIHFDSVSPILTKAFPITSLGSTLLLVGLGLLYYRRDLVFGFWNKVCEFIVECMGINFVAAYIASHHRRGSFSVDPREMFSDLTKVVVTIFDGLSADLVTIGNHINLKLVYLESLISSQIETVTKIVAGIQPNLDLIEPTAFLVVALARAIFEHPEVAEYIKESQAEIKAKVAEIVAKLGEAKPAAKWVNTLPLKEDVHAKACTDQASAGALIDRDRGFGQREGKSFVEQGNSPADEVLLGKAEATPQADPGQAVKATVNLPNETHTSADTRFSKARVTVGYMAIASLVVTVVSVVATQLLQRS